MSLSEEWTQDRVRWKIQQALKTLHAKDQYLLDRQVHERTIAHRLAIYLENEFPGWHVDCEYNRMGGDAKRIGDQLCDCGSCRSDPNALVYPDIIVHCRGSNQNLLVIELKKSQNSTECDKIKLCHYKTELKYCFALSLSVSVNPGDDALVWIERPSGASDHAKGPCEEHPDPPIC